MKGRKSWAMAYCGMAAALSIAFMLLGAVIPIFMYIAPAIASFLVATVCVECGKTLAWTAYGAVSLLSLLFVPDKEVALTFVFLLGYYPLVKPKFEHIRPALLRGLCKLLLCNGGILLMYGLVLLLIPGGSISQEMRTTALAVSLTTLAMGNVAFLLYDRALHNMLQGDEERNHRKIRRMFLRLKQARRPAGLYQPQRGAKNGSNTVTDPLKGSHTKT